MPPTLGAMAESDIQPAYADAVVKKFAVAATIWAVLGFMAGDFIAWQLAFPSLNLDLEWTTFGRMRPVHTTLVLFAFGGNVLIGTSFFVVQRTCQASLFGGRALGNCIFWSYQALMVAAPLSYVLGLSQSREYAEMEWWIDIPFAVVWVAYLMAYVGTIFKRSQPHVYVANWFYLAFILTMALLHFANNVALPAVFVGGQWWKSYSLYAGVQDAMTQWWYGHNAVGFLLTAGFLGIMYYFVPKRAGRPVYSYRLSIIHFWALVFLYTWLGAHHLHYTALPDWVQTLGMTFSVMMWMPSWGGMINGLMTLSGAWDKLRTDPVLRFLITSVAFYGMSTFEGPLMGVKAVNALSHYTDWTIGHVHSGALGWVAFVSFGALYHLIPKLWGRADVYSLRLVSVHFWLASVGIVLYITAMWISGIMQGLMWRAYDNIGFLQYSFIETVEAMHPYYVVRATGGLLFVTGSLIMAYNLWRTIRGDVRREQPASALVQTA
jgi:cytochrome c oxidase cbb3-type subunit 1